MGKIDTNPPKPATDDVAAETATPRMIVAVGRQRVGKTTLLNAITEIYRGLGAELDVWNADQHNRSHTLSLFHPDALEPKDGVGLQDQRKWIEDRVRDQVQNRRDAVLDVGGGLTALNALIEEVKLVRSLERRGVRPVLLYVLGSDRADLDYLERFTQDQSFLPAATVIVLNSGLVTTGRSANLAFEPLLDHPVVLAALMRGAKAIQMPALGCLSEVIDRGLSFRDFADGKQKEGHPETSFFDQERVWLWLNQAMPKFLLDIPSEWMPRTKQPLAVTE